MWEEAGRGRRGEGWELQLSGPHYREITGLSGTGGLMVSSGPRSSLGPILDRG